MNTTAMNAPCEAMPDRQDKHMELHYSIMDSKSCVAALERLLQRINHETQPIAPGDEPKQPEPSLLILLDGGPDQVRNTNSRIHDLIDHIENCLF